jgi:hypothetical protein
MQKLIDKQLFLDGACRIGPTIPMPALTLFLIRISQAILSPKLVGARLFSVLSQVPHHPFGKPMAARRDRDAK